MEKNGAFDKIFSQAMYDMQAPYYKENVTFDEFKDWQPNQNEYMIIENLVSKNIKPNSFFIIIVDNPKIEESNNIFIKMTDIKKSLYPTLGDLAFYNRKKNIKIVCIVNSMDPEINRIYKRAMKCDYIELMPKEISTKYPEETIPERFRRHIYEHMSVKIFSAALTAKGL